MGRRFSMNNFEESLKEQADDFKMIPSKKVWHGIYNDIHPGRRWPSITVALLLICTLVFIGQLNLRPKTPVTASSSIGADASQPSGGLKTGHSLAFGQNQHRRVANANNRQALTVFSLNLPATTFQVPFANASVDNNSLALQPGIVNADGSGFASGLRPDQRRPDWAVVQPRTSANQPLEKINMPDRIEPGNPHDADNNRQLIAANGLRLPSSAEMELPIVNKIANLNALPDLKDLQQISFGNVSVRLSPFSEYHAPAKGASARRLNTGATRTQQKAKINVRKSWLYYIAPQLNSVLFFGRALQPLNNNNYATVSVSPKQYKVLFNPAFGFEGGLQMNYALGRKLTVTAGLHVTYSGYNIISNDIHPTFATLVLKNPKTHLDYVNSYITHYGDGTGLVPVTIRNYSLQSSLPIGIQYAIVGNDKVKLNVAGDLEPSIILRSNAFILSTDGNNYINDPGLIRKLNMSSNFGIFISFTSSRYKWQIGPDVRYQWFSTYKADYSIKEHLIDYGIRIGISPFRK